MVKTVSTYFRTGHQQAAAIDKTELKLLKSRRKPAGIAARAILRSGKGHKYWSSYDQESQQKIQSIAEELNEIIFQPKLKNPIKTLDLPLGGKNYSSQGQSLILELVNRTNQSKSSEIDTIEEPDDIDGQQTLRYLNNCLTTVRRLNSSHPSSLGLHPAVYFYSKDGRHKPASFWAAIDLIQHLERTNKFKWFTEARSKFESFLQKYDYIVQQIVRKHRSASAAYPFITKLYLLVIEEIRNGQSIEAIPSRIKANADFSYVTLDDDGGEEVTHQDFSRERKSEIFMKEALLRAVKCKICDGLLHQNSITIDHIERKQDGGIGNVENEQLAHPYCNTSYKN